MCAKREFLIKAIEEVQETNRFLDTKAGVLVVFESSLFIIAVSSLADTSVLQLIQNLISRAAPGYLIFLAAYLIIYIVALTIHILITLKGIFPQRNPEAHVELGDSQPRRLFFLFELDENEKIRPSLPEYIARLASVSDDDIIQEYALELSKLSYIRRKKSDSLRLSFRLLSVLIVGAVVFGFLLALGGLIY
jgi:hypothetical protein